MSERKLIDSLKNLERALLKLGEGIDVPRDNPLVLEGTIQRFEYAIELLWKTLKRALSYEGIVRTKTPRESLKESYAIGWIDNETIWLDMLDCRNSTSHLYLEDELVEETYNKIVTYYPEMMKALNFLKGKYNHLK